MEVPPEIVPHVNEPGPKTAIPPNASKAEAIEPQVELFSKFAEIKARAESHVQKAKTMICPPNSDKDEKKEQYPFGNSAPEMSPKAVLAQLEALVQNQSVTTAEFMFESERLLDVSIKNPIIPPSSSDTKKPLAILGQVLQKITPFKEMNVKKQEQLREKDQQIVEQILEKKKVIAQKREEILTRAALEVAVTCNEYENLLQEILQDGTIVKEVREYQIQQRITPEVDRTCKEKNLPEGYGVSIISGLRELLENKKNDKSDSDALEELLSVPKDIRNYTLGSLCDSLVDTYDKSIIKDLVVKMAAEELAPIFAVDSSYKYGLSEPTISAPMSGILEKAIAPEKYDRDKEMPFGTQILSELGRSGYGHTKFSDSDNSIQLWQALKSSKTANGLFGEIIKKEDQKTYLSALERSLNPSGGGDIELFYAYPTPEIIRNLVVVAASTASDNYSRSASHTLDKLRRRPDWKNILDEAEKVYPSLRTTRPVLEFWTYDEEEEHGDPNMQDAAGDLFTFILQDKQIDSRLKELTTQALSNRLLLDRLVEKGLISVSQAVNLKVTENLLKKASEETKKLRDSQDQNIISTPYVEAETFRLSLRGKLVDLMKDKPDWDKEHKARRDKALQNIGRLNELSQTILENKTDYRTLSSLSGYGVINELQKESLKTTDIKLFLEAVRTIPALTYRDEVLKEFIKKPINGERLQFFKDMSSTYFGSYEQNPTYDEHEKNSTLITNLDTVIRLADDSVISKERALELAGKMREEKYALSDEEFKLALRYPKAYLTADQDVEFFKKISKEYEGELKDQFAHVISLVDKSVISKERALELLSRIKEEKYAMTSSEFGQVLQLRKTFLETDQDIKFCERLTGEFGKKADSLIKGYNLCILEGSITTSDKDIIFEFAKQFRVITPNIIKGYKEAKEAGTEKVFLASLRALAERMTGAGNITDEERKSHYYKDLLKHVYPNNSGQWGSFEKTENCTDRSSDLMGFKIEPRYEIDLLSQSEIKVKEGQVLDRKVKEDVQKPILEVAEKMNLLKHDKEKVSAALSEDINKAISEIIQKGNFQGINLESSSNEEKLFLILADSIYGNQTLEQNEVKKLIINYEFANFEDITDYIAGTNDRVSRASNQDYALFCEVQTFYADRIKEVNRKLVRAAWENPAISALMPQYLRSSDKKQQ